MLVLKNLNNISEKLKEECIPSFGAGEIRTFRMLNGVVNNDPDITERLKRPVFYPNTQIQTWGRIKDPYANDGKGAFIDIGLVETFDTATERATKFKCIVKGHGIGMFTLSGDSIEDIELYEILCISNENAHFKYRDQKVSPLFEMVEQVDAVEQAEDEFEMLAETVVALKKLNTSQKRQLATILVLDPTYTDDTLNSELKKYAKGDPKKVLDAITNVQTTLGTKSKGKRQKEEVLA